MFLLIINTVQYILMITYKEKLLTINQSNFSINTCKNEWVNNFLFF